LVENVGEFTALIGDGNSLADKKVRAIKLHGGRDLWRHSVDVEFVLLTGWSDTGIARAPARLAAEQRPEGG
ncbi:MAG TPA: hypothetical protein VIV27_02940, partial [Halioglobus sp.]